MHELQDIGSKATGSPPNVPQNTFFVAGSVTYTYRMNHIEPMNKKRSDHIYPHQLGEAQATSLLASLGSVVRWRTLKPSTCQIPGNHSPPNPLSQLTARLEFLPESLDKPMFDVLLTWLTFLKYYPKRPQHLAKFH